MPASVLSPSSIKDRLDDANDELIDVGDILRTLKHICNELRPNAKWAGLPIIIADVHARVDKIQVIVSELADEYRDESVTAGGAR